MSETIFGNANCGQCGDTILLNGEHRCKPSYKELKAELQTAAKCNSCMRRQLTEPLSCNPVGDECDQDWRDKGRIAELEGKLKQCESVLADTQQKNIKLVLELTKPKKGNN